MLTRDFPIGAHDFYIFFLYDKFHHRPQIYIAIQSKAYAVTICTAIYLGKNDFADTFKQNNLKKKFILQIPFKKMVIFSKLCNTKILAV